MGRGHGFFDAVLSLGGFCERDCLQPRWTECGAPPQSARIPAISAPSIYLDHRLRCGPAESLYKNRGQRTVQAPQLIGRQNLPPFIWQAVSEVDVHVFLRRLVFELRAIDSEEIENAVYVRLFVLPERRKLGKQDVIWHPIGDSKPIHHPS